MSSSSLNTLLVQRIETALGVPLAQHSQLASVQGRLVHPPGRAAAIAALESATSNADFAKTLQNKTARMNAGGFRHIHAPGPDASHIEEGSRPSSTQAAHTSKVSSANALPGAAVPARSTQTHLSQIGRILSPLLEQFPQGGGPLTSTQPLFISAVLTLRAQAAANSMTQGQMNGSGNSPGNLTSSGSKSVLPGTPQGAPGATTGQERPVSALSSVLTGALMQVLRGQIVNSGLFYESHVLRQMQKSGGKIASLADEPQHASKAIASKDSEIDLSLRPLVRQQLDILSGQPIQWQGQVWPGAFMQWEINTQPIQDSSGFSDGEEDQEKERINQDSAADSTWSSTLDLQLPNLGAVNVRIDIRGQEVKLKLMVDEKGLLLADYLQGIHKNLVGAGLEPHSITVSKQAESHE